MGYLLNILLDFFFEKTISFQGFNLKKGRIADIIPLLINFSKIWWQLLKDSYSSWSMSSKHALAPAYMNKFLLYDESWSPNEVTCLLIPVRRLTREFLKVALWCAHHRACFHFRLPDQQFRKPSDMHPAPNFQHGWDDCKHFGSRVWHRWCWCLIIW
jgi:hypothetical protein